MPGTMPPGDQPSEIALSVLYKELHRRASRYMRGQEGGHTLQATALVNEAWVRLNKAEGPREWKDQDHFLASASRAMRCVLVDHARRKHRRGGPMLELPLDLVSEFENRAVDLLALDGALEELKAFDPLMARGVELRFFGGQTVVDSARILGISKRTFERRWKATRAWLLGRIA